MILKYLLFKRKQIQIYLTKNVHLQQNAAPSIYNYLNGNRQLI